MKLGVIGCGNMGSALVRGILSNRILPFNSIYASDKDLSRTKALHRKFGISVSTGEELARKCNFIIVAVKPQDAKKLFASILKRLDQSKHLVSIMAGVTLKSLESFLSKSSRKIAITRAMPNIAALAGRSITCLSHNKMVKDRLLINKIFSSIGEVMEIEEKEMDAVTALAGSGPAYFFYLAECLTEAAMKLGIKKEKALKLALATLAGSGALSGVLNLPPADMIARVTSKKGTTMEALRILKLKNFKGIVREAVKAAAKRSRELSKGA